MDLTEAIHSYVEKRFGSLDKFMHSTAEVMQVEIGKTTNHHKQGDVFSAEVNLSIGGKKFYAVSHQADLYTAIDDVKEEIEHQIIADKERSTTLFRRGARSVKKMFKGLSDRNPFTSK